MKGRYNVDVIRYDYYRDATIALEAFKAGQYDVRLENSSKDWATGYDSPALRAGLIKKEEIPNELPSGMQGFAYNLRRPLFQDPRVREALAYAFDFEWSNKNLFYGAYTAHAQLFRQFRAGGDRRAAGRGAEDPRKVSAARSPTGSSRRNTTRRNTTVPAISATACATALKLLKEAGWTFKGEKLVNDETGQPFEFEILLDNPQFERIVLPFAKNLERMGITARVRTVDNAQYQKRMETFDYDMAVVAFGQSLSPGNEQREYWGSQAADEQGSRNLIGIKSKVVDELIEGAEVVRIGARPARAWWPTPMRSTGYCNMATT